MTKPKDSSLIVFHKKKDEYHGKVSTPEYVAWDNMIARCERPSQPMYEIYGGRGITVHPAWRKSFQAFYDYIGDKPSPIHSLDRIESDGNYEPGNVRWATPLQQNLNQRLRMDNLSGYKGVSWGKQSQKWRVVIFYDGKQIHIGNYKDKDIAANMYDQYAIQLYGDDIRTNFIYE